MADPRLMTPAHRPSRRQVARAYLVLPHAVPILVVLGATAALALVAAGGWPGTGALLALLGAMLGGQLAVGAVNELVDADLDALAKPTKPIPSGLVSRQGARVVAIVGLVLMTAAGLTLGPVPFALCALGNGAGVAYSFWFKRTVWSWVPYLVALPLLPIWVWSALSEINPVLFAVYPIGAAAGIAVQIAQSLPDVEADRMSGVRTLAVALGPGRAQRVAWAGMLLAAALAAGLAPLLTDEPTRVLFGAVLASGLVALSAAISLRDPRRGVQTCFPCLAVATAVLGVGWAAALVAP
jgi:4-hydroxybenzoate polyprenyltransferase